MKNDFADSKHTATPFVSVIMPVRNEARYIDAALRSVIAQDYPHDRMEVIVADGMSSDGTRDVVRSFQDRHPNIVLIDNPDRIAPTGLNAALRAAKGSIIVRIDGHCQPAPDYVSCCVRHLEDESVDGVGGPIDTIGDSFVAEAIAAAMSSSFGVGGSAFRTVKDRAMHVETIAFPAYTRKAIREAGLYDEQLVRNQDDEYNYRMLELGGTLLLTPDVRSRYFSRASLRSLWRQYFQYGFWKVRVMQKHPRQMRWRQFVPPALVATLLVSLVVAPWSTLGRIALLTVAGTYLATLLIGALWTARKSGYRYFPLLPVVFGTLHLSYGCGFLAGLFKFWNRWSDRTGQVPSLDIAVPERGHIVNY